ncbi:MAG: adenylyl-sulfate kinase [Nitrospirae bacterium]|nr:adenylyl-sulfate kinase [Nitrospirota bacterium]MCL5236950.1 adenylyl-sulfate kinase [Nitrospirota bacterium]
MSGFVIWLTGLPGSGKSTIADGVKELFPGFVVLRMDKLREIVTPEPAFSESERDLVYRAIVYTAKTLSDLGHEVIIDATGNMRKWRELARLLVPNFAEIYLKCSLQVCAGREASRADTRGAPPEIYKKGKAGWPVPGMQVPYEEPLNPELVVDTDKLTFDDSLSLIREFISERLPGLRQRHSG